MLRVPPHRASSSEAVAWGELPCSSFLELSELVPEQPTISRRKAHPIRKVPTKAISCPWRTTAHPPSLRMHPLLLTSRSMPHNEALRISKEGLFTVVRGRGILRTSPLRRSKKFGRPLVTLHIRNPTPAELS